MNVYGHVILWPAIFLLACQMTGVAGHGRMLEPCERSSMWRCNFSTPVNYDDLLDCGGHQAQFDDVNKGRCGECGDMWSIPRPRPNDEGGLYGTGLIARNYTAGELITVNIQITSSNNGYFEFRLCNKSSSSELVTQSCLNQTVLKLEDGSTQFFIGDSSGMYYPKVQLPAGFKCRYCVFQWYYRGANYWGECPDGTWAKGCGDQDTIVNCADIAIN